MAETMPSPFHTQDSAILVDEPGAINRPRSTLLELPGFRSLEEAWATPRGAPLPRGPHAPHRHAIGPEDRYACLEAMWDANWGMAIRENRRPCRRDSVSSDALPCAFVKRLSDWLRSWRLSASADRGKPAGAGGWASGAERGEDGGAWLDEELDVQQSLESLPGFHSGWLSRGQLRSICSLESEASGCGGSGGSAPVGRASSAMSLTSCGSSVLGSLGNSETEEKGGEQAACDALGAGPGDPPCDSASDAWTPVKTGRTAREALGGGEPAQDEKVCTERKAADYEAVRERWDRAWHGGEEPGGSLRPTVRSRSFCALRRSFTSIKSFFDDGFSLILRKMPSFPESLESPGSHRPFTPAPLHSVNSICRVHLPTHHG